MDFAEQRTILASERTYSAWIRTGLSSVAAGIAVVRLLNGELGPLWLTRTMGITFIIVGMATFALALLRYRDLSKDLEFQGIRTTPSWLITIVTVGMIVTAVLALFLIFQT